MRFRCQEISAWRRCRANLDAADVVLAIGTEFGETEMYPEPQPAASSSGKLIRIDIDPLQLTTAVRSALAIMSDAKLACGRHSRALWAKTKQATDASRGRFAPKRCGRPCRKDLWPACRTHRKLMEIVTTALPDAIVAGDQTEPVYATNQFYQAPQPRSYFNSSTGYGTLGLWPARRLWRQARRAGTSRPLPDRRWRLAILPCRNWPRPSKPKLRSPIIVWNNSGYGEIKSFHGRAPAFRRLASISSRRNLSALQRPWAVPHHGPRPSQHLNPSCAHRPLGMCQP